MRPNEQSGTAVQRLMRLVIITLLYMQVQREAATVGDGAKENILLLLTLKFQVHGSEGLGFLYQRWKTSLTNS